MLDEELMQEIALGLPNMPYLFISSITGYGIPALKDILWRELNSDDHVPMSVSRDSLVHRDLDVSNLDLGPEEKFPDDDYDNVDDEEDDDNYFEEDF